VAAIGIQDEKWGERPVLLIVVQDGADEEAIKSSIAAVANEAVETGSLSKWAVPDQFRFVAEITKTSVGKIDKKRLRAEFE
jgi:fatty-acyl-CoA synthase